MASPELQAQAQALNAKMQGAAAIAIDELEKSIIRPIARQSHVCVVKCYDTAGKRGSSEELDICSRKCQSPYLDAQNIIQQVW